jgi:DnaK suppressor protein
VPHDEDIRRTLEQRRDELTARVEGFAARPERGAAQGFGKRVGDGTVEAISRLTDIGVGRSLETGLLRTERALTKLDEGSYGRCDRCGGPLAAGRLAALPDSTLCVACAGAARRLPPARR